MRTAKGCAESGLLKILKSLLFDLRQHLPIPLGQDVIQKISRLVDLLQSGFLARADGFVAFREHVLMPWVDYLSFLTFDPDVEPLQQCSGDD